MTRYLPLCLVVAALAAAPAAAAPLSASDAAYRISSPSVWNEAGDMHVAGFVCRVFDLSAPRPERVRISLFDASGRLVESGDAPIEGGTLDAKGVSCGHYAAVFSGDMANAGKMVVAALGADGRPLKMRDIAQAS